MGDDHSEAKGTDEVPRKNENVFKNRDYFPVFQTHLV